MNYQAIANTAALTTGALLQLPNEIIPFMEFVDKIVQPKNFLELGLCQGGSFYVWCSIATPGGIKLGIDLPNGPWGVGHVRTDREIEQNKHMFETFAPNCHVLFNDTKEKVSIDWVKEKLGEDKLDFIFIDADHSYEGVKADYYNYLPFVKKGGYIGMHDIKETKTHKDYSCEVHRFWKELEGDKKEFLDNTADWAGIGVIQVK